MPTATAEPPPVSLPTSGVALPGGVPIALLVLTLIAGLAAAAVLERRRH
jgi:hypothetical protein